MIVQILYIAFNIVSHSFCIDGNPLKLEIQDVSSGYPLETTEGVMEGPITIKDRIEKGYENLQFPYHIKLVSKDPNNNVRYIDEFRPSGLATDEKRSRNHQYSLYNGYTKTFQGSSQTPWMYSDPFQVDQYPTTYLNHSPLQKFTALNENSPHREMDVPGNSHPELSVQIPKLSDTNEDKTPSKNSSDAKNLNYLELRNTEELINSSKPLKPMDQLSVEVVLSSIEDNPDHGTVTLPMPIVEESTQPFGQIKDSTVGKVSSGNFTHSSNATDLDHLEIGERLVNIISLFSQQRYILPTENLNLESKSLLSLTEVESRQPGELQTENDEHGGNGLYSGNTEEIQIDFEVNILEQEASENPIGLISQRPLQDMFSSREGGIFYSSNPFPLPIENTFEQQCGMVRIESAEDRHGHNNIIYSNIEEREESEALKYSPLSQNLSLVGKKMADKMASHEDENFASTSNRHEPSSPAYQLVYNAPPRPFIEDIHSVVKDSSLYNWLKSYSNSKHKNNTGETLDEPISVSQKKPKIQVAVQDNTETGAGLLMSSAEDIGEFRAPMHLVHKEEPIGIFYAMPEVKIAVQDNTEIQNSLRMPSREDIENVISQAATDSEEPNGVFYAMSKMKETKQNNTETLSGLRMRSGEEVANLFDSPSIESEEQIGGFRTMPKMKETVQDNTETGVGLQMRYTQPFIGLYEPTSLFYRKPYLPVDMYPIFDEDALY